MTSSLLRILTLVGATTTVGIFLACATSSTPPEAPATATPNTVAAVQLEPPAAVQRVVIGTEADWAPFYESLDEMVNVSDTILMGRVTGVLLPFDPRPGYLGVTPGPTGPPLPPDDPKAKIPVRTPSPEELSRPPGRWFAVYSVAVVRVIKSPRVRSGDTIGVFQNYGVFDGVAYETIYERLMEAGSTYVFFLRESTKLRTISIPEPWGVTFEGAPYGRFLLDSAGKLEPASDFWRSDKCPVCYGVAAITSLTVDEAAAKIAAAIAQAGRPTPTATPSPTPTSSPTPAPSPSPTPAP